MSFLHVPADTLNEVCRFSDPPHIPTRHRRSAANSRPAGGQDHVVFGEDETAAGEGAAQGSIHWVARELSISVSTLKRRLSEEGTTFRELRQSFLRERAMLRLLDRSMSVTEVATELGYSDLTNFSHAFKRWTGRSPNEFRHP